jgi:hypothetical protein
MAGQSCPAIAVYNYYSINLVGFYKFVLLTDFFKLINCSYEPELLESHPDGRRYADRHYGPGPDK